MTVVYLDYDTVVQINADHGGHGSGVRDEAGIRSALGRPSATFVGIDLFPSIAAKAAVLLHGLSSTQNFHDGNKRTAWLACNLFLELNNAPLKKLPIIAAESFILAVATKAFENEEEGADRAISKATEWLTHMRFRMRDRADYVIVARSANVSESFDTTFDMQGGQLGGFGVPAFPALTSLGVVFRLQFRAEDAYRDWSLKIHTEPEGGPFDIVNPSREVLEHLEHTGQLPDDFDIERDTVRYESAHPLSYEDLSGVHTSGVQPYVGVHNISLRIHRPGLGHLVLTLNGEFLARRTLAIRYAPEIGVSIQEIDESIRNLLNRSGPTDAV